MTTFSIAEASSGIFTRLPRSVFQQTAECRLRRKKNANTDSFSRKPQIESLYLFSAKFTDVSSNVIFLGFATLGLISKFKSIILRQTPNSLS